MTDLIKHIDPREIREMLGCSQQDIADTFGISQSRVSRLEADPSLLRPWQLREYIRLSKNGIRKPQKAEPVKEVANG